MTSAAQTLGSPAATPVQVPLVTEPLGILGSFRNARRNVLELIPELATHVPIVSGRTGKRWHMVMDPESNRRILRDAVENYPKSDVTKMILRPAIGDSLFVAEGAHWHWQRRVAAPVFSHRNIANLAPVMTRAAEHAAARLDAATGRAANLFDEMVAATFEVIADVTLSGGDTFDRSVVHRAINNYIADTARVSLLDVIGAPAWVPRLGRIGSTQAMRDMKRVADSAIDA
ncbi:MAG: cytochrome P450, partial [Paracoccaceae bacterium]|nr:cytochrome P450 [Paracoccaceae bacterium]